MALSYEYTYWHLTPNGWVAGDSKTDFNSWNKPTPAETLKTVRYTEKLGHNFYLEKDIETVYETLNKTLLENAEKSFPFKGRIEVYS
ncbi:MAG: hypothetical protein DI539_15910 [Flavobacterium psychrophilum]|nr:MAG: hypothetical protein DI539_15910 [Flavobacterium psychrophilum]